MAKIDRELELRLARNIAGISLPKASTYSVKRPGTTEEMKDQAFKERFHSSFGLFHETGPFSFEKLIKPSLSKIVANLNTKNVEVASTALQNLSSILSDNYNNMTEISTYLSNHGVPGNLAGKVRDIMSGDQFTDKEWFLMSLVYKVVHVFVENGMLIEEITKRDANFIELTTHLLNHPHVLEHHCKSSVQLHTVDHAFKTLLSILTTSPESVVDVYETLLTTVRTYFESSSEEVRAIAIQTELTMDMIFSDRRPFTEELDDFEEKKPSKLSQTLLWCTKNDHLKSMLTSGKREDEWRELWSTVQALDTLSRGNTAYVVSICKEGIIETIHTIMTTKDVFHHFGVSQRVDFIMSKLLLVLLRCTKHIICQKYFLDCDFSGIVQKLLISKSDKEIRSKALALISVIHGLKKSSETALTFKCTSANVEMVAAAVYGHELYTDQFCKQIGAFLVDSGFLKQLCIQLRDLVSKADEARSTESSDQDWYRVCNGMKVLADWSIHTKEFVDDSHNELLTNIIKPLLTSKIFKEKNESEDNEFLRHAIHILNIFLIHGFEEDIKDDLISNTVYCLSNTRGSLKFYATSCCILTRMRTQDRNDRMPRIIDAKDLKSSVDFMVFFLKSYGKHGGEKIVASLAETLCDEGVLKFIASDISQMIIAPKQTLGTLINETLDNFLVLAMLSQHVAVASSKLSAEILQSDYMRLFLRLLSDDEVIQEYAIKSFHLQNVFTPFLQLNVAIISELLEQEESAVSVDRWKILPKVLPFLSGTMVNQVDMVGKLWTICAKMWIAYGNTWPKECGITANKLTENIICPVTINIIKSVMTDLSTSSKIKQSIVDMIDTNALLKKLFKKVRKKVSGLKIHTDKDVNDELTGILDFLHVFSTESEDFNKSIVAHQEYSVLMNAVLGGTTDPRIVEVDTVTAEYSKRCFRLLLAAIKSKAIKKESLDQQYIRLLRKWVSCEESEIQYLVLGCLALISSECPVENCIDNISSLSCASYIITILVNLVYHGKLTLVQGKVELPDITLQILHLFARRRSRHLQPLYYFLRQILGDLIDTIIESKLAFGWEKTALEHTVHLIWSLATSRYSDDKMSDDSTLVNALLKLLDEKYSYLKNEVSCALLEITGEVPEDKLTLKEKYDVSIVTPDALQNMAGDINEALTDDGYRVVGATLKLPGIQMIDRVNCAQFIIFLFNEDTASSILCQTAINHAQRTKTPFIGVYVGHVDVGSWEQSTMPPQNKVYMRKTQKNDVCEMLSAVRRLLPRVNLCLQPDLQERDSQHIVEFNAFADECDVGQLFFRENFVGSVFDSKGGYLTLPSQEVVLYIPPGAIEEKQRVYCHGNDYKYGGIHDGKVVLSPIVHCGPDGAQFKEDVVLIYPHCAVNENQWNFTALTKPMGGSWNELPDDEVIVKDEFVYVFLDHFTGFTAEGDAKDSGNAQRRITVAATGEFHGDKCCQVLVGAWCDTGSSSDEKMPGSGIQWQRQTTMCVGDKETVIMTSVEGIEEGWQQRGGMHIKMIRLADIGTDKEVCTANCQHTFRYTPKEVPDDFFCTVSVVTPEDNNTTTLEVVVQNTASKAQKQTYSEEEDHDLKDMTNAELYRKLNTDWSPLDSQIKEDVWRYLCQLLDVSRDGLKDWKGFAGKLNLESGQIHTLSCKKSPGSRVLKFFFSAEKIRGVKLCVSLAKLMNIFTEMENDAAKTCISTYMATLQISENNNRNSAESPTAGFIGGSHMGVTQTEEGEVKKITVCA
ncbi:uncharacterized protein [Ptychodera flava]|uniref:uncharacterized protein isoform X2 n=1 Tax=Ptychodera flava TaxID=63121 RepID=UPI003969C1E8